MVGGGGGGDSLWYLCLAVSRPDRAVGWMCQVSLITCRRHDTVDTSSVQLGVGDGQETIMLHWTVKLGFNDEGRYFFQDAIESTCR